MQYTSNNRAVPLGGDEKRLDGLEDIFIEARSVE